MFRKYMLLWMMVGLVVSGAVQASGVPIHSGAEATTQAVDSGRSGILDDMVKLQDKMVDSMTNAIGGRETFGLKSLQTNLQGALSNTSRIISTPQNAVKNMLGSSGGYGNIVIKKSGEHIAPLKTQIEKTLIVAAKATDRINMTTAEQSKIIAQRAKAMEETATQALAKAWIAQTEAANSSASISNTEAELPNAVSQQSIMGTILRVQEEIQKNLNTRLSIMAEDLSMAGLAAMDNGM